jgi:hypothetical protein
LHYTFLQFDYFKGGARGFACDTCMNAQDVGLFKVHAYHVIMNVLGLIMNECFRFSIFLYMKIDEIGFIKNVKYVPQSSIIFKRGNKLGRKGLRVRVLDALYIRCTLILSSVVM